MSLFVIEIAHVTVVCAQLGCASTLLLWEIAYIPEHDIRNGVFCH
jgi:UPF0716 family protein affecting phage T7 exclusion